MHLYSFTLERPTAITQAIHGNFAGTKAQEIVVARGHYIELLRPDPSTGKIVPLLSVDVFGVVRSLASFRLTGANKDYIVVGSDSGRIVILEYNAAKNALERVHQETFGKSGCRRIVPGQLLATDPKGRAVMIGALEKQKLVYILNRDAAARLTISSPLEGHKSHTVVFAIAGVDVGFENPIFACLELDYEDADGDHTGEAARTAQQTLTYYELDLGLNHVVRKSSEPLEEMANMIIPVPGGNDGPSGVLLCSEGAITYRNEKHVVRCAIPRRRNDISDAERAPLVVSYTSYKTKSLFFFLVQTEQGDLFKLTLSVVDDAVRDIRIKYFDTVPPAASICLLRSGFLFVAAEFGNHSLFQVAHLADDDDERDFGAADGVSVFTPRPLRNLVHVEEIESLSPITDCKIADLANEDAPQLYALCGRGPRSSMRVLRHGLPVAEMAVSDLPGTPTAVWTAKKFARDKHDSYLVVSFVNATLVLSIGETVEEVTDSGFLGTSSTLSVSQLGEADLLQVYADGIRHIHAHDGNTRRISQWRPPAKRQVVRVAANERQVVIALTGGELVYFELDASGTLNEHTERRQVGSDVRCLAIGAVPEGQVRSRFMAVGDSENTVRIYSLEPQECLQPLSMQALPTPAESLCIAEMAGGFGSGGEGEHSSLFLMVGLDNGVMLRSVLDTVTGALSDTRTRYLGSRGVRLVRVRAQEKDAVLALSSRPWLLYPHQARIQLTPLSYQALEHAAHFSSEQCPEGIVGVSGTTLRIVAVDRIGAVFNQSTVPLQHTPRRMVIHPQTNYLISIEADHRQYTEPTKRALREQVAMANDDMVTEEDELPEDVFGAPKAPAGKWASAIRVIDPIQGKTLHVYEFDENEAAMSVGVCAFHGRDGEVFVVVGTAKDLQLNPRSCSGGFLHTFRMVDEGKQLELYHKTPVEDVPGAIHPFQGRIVAGVGNLVRIYDLGKRKLLRKCENKHVPNFVTSISTMGPRIVVGDVQESFHFLKYRPTENLLTIFADDTVPRWLTCATMVDYDTMAGADKFGNVYIVRLPADCSDDVDEDPTGARSVWERGTLNGAQQKVEILVNFHVGDTVTSLQKTSLVPGGPEALVYTTLLGAIGVLAPFTSREDIDFFQHLEMHMRQEAPPLLGRDHLSYRSYYFPCKSVIDGDLCEGFNALDASKRRSIAEELDRTPPEVAKKLEDMRVRFAF